MSPTSDQILAKLWQSGLWDPLLGALGLLNRVLPLERPRRPLPAPEKPGLLPRPAVREKVLVAGAAVEDITPLRPEGVYLAGFAADRKALGVRDPISARALYLHDGETPLLLICLDLIGLSRARVERIRARIFGTHRENVIVHCTHNHQGPDTLGLWGKSLFGFLPVKSGLDDAYLGLVERKAARAAERAVEAAVPARLSFAQAEFDREGRWVKNEHGASQDRTARFLQARAADGAVIATLVQHACHPETLWREGRVISADFCGACCRAIEQELGGVALYANGALGAMVTTALDRSESEAERERFLDGLGEALAALAKERLSRARPAARPRIRIACKKIHFPARENRLFVMLHRLGIVEARDIGDSVESEATLVRIGPASILSLPGEPEPEAAQALLAGVLGRPRFLLGLANDELGYLMPPQKFSDPAYAYECAMSPGPSALSVLQDCVRELEERLKPAGPRPARAAGTIGRARGKVRARRAPDANRDPPTQGGNE